MTQEALKLAKILENIEGYRATLSAAHELRRLHEENKKLKEALAQPEQEPVAYLCKPDENGLFGLPTPDRGCKDCFPVYRHPQALLQDSD